MSEDQQGGSSTFEYDATPRELPPAGAGYIHEIVKMTAGASKKKGTPEILVETTIIDGPGGAFAGKKGYLRFYPTTEARFIFDQFVRAAAIPTKDTGGGRKALDFETAPGKRFSCSAKIETYEGVERERWEQYLPVPGQNAVAPAGNPQPTDAGKGPQRVQSKVGGVKTA